MRIFSSHNALVRQNFVMAIKQEQKYLRILLLTFWLRKIVGCRFPLATGGLRE
jgi:hypothetical protein